MMRNRGFTIVELLISLGVLVVLGMITWPAYQNFLRRSYYSEILTQVAPYKESVAACYQDKHNLQFCNGGSNHIAPNILIAKNGLASLKVYAGIISVTPVPHKGVLASDTYILTPTIVKDGLTWTATGAAVTNAYAE